MTFKERLIKLILENAVEFGDFTLKNKQKSSYYLDMRKLTISSNLLYVVEEVKQTIITHAANFDAIGGPCVGADPIIAGYIVRERFVGDKDDLRAFFIRSTEKDHGKSGLIIGSVKPGDKCVVVEDVTTSGGSLMHAVKTIQEFGCEVVLAVTVVDRLQGAEKLFQEANVPFKSVVTIKDLGI